MLSHTTKRACPEFLDFDDAKALCESAGLMFTQPLVRGRLEKCVAAPLEFDSTMPARLGMPPLPSGSNVAEGFVVRPARLAHLTEAQHATATGGGRRRLLFKRKHPRFEERVAVSEQAAKHGAGAGAAGGAVASLRPEQLLEWELSALVNVQRLDSAVSKVGRPGREPKGGGAEAAAAWRKAARRVLAEMVCDVLEDAELEGVIAAYRERVGGVGEDGTADPLLRVGGLELPRDPLAARAAEWAAVPAPLRRRAVKAMTAECAGLVMRALSQGQ